MNIESLINVLSDKMSKISQDLKAKVSSTDLNNPGQMVKMQYSIQQYSNLVSIQSSLVRVFKDLFSSIISKI
ncbi:EscF/YscF/HrpA family type III secretion system needle major subunit [Candidatus Hamiltonella defensa]|uniref:EscF/YscF/HrpA family type III secretion system needle major subunit n=1 Tax=Candidatus Williamhamiltonella defendens TaxID=138072 RepID=A0AAC9VJC6_9ENTR|nr:type III secretion system needle filament subunit SctF [Candidatus Hamiltonella defensa]ASV32890.1 EscF/YscF/HrpA family type III secretion system needle major subunit [Candidatus Hamiltonella defensa]ATW31069.1 EscF/YscF/HrpA family type III secretion system needle major subunit [Candidatus Hamiltonella defensa]AWK15844.1 EscF/YscF/HrpA family type III secretion system needle major subunit [Candidatus Hamiltonella defensa]MBK4361870.1 EscF/YscF/HrpA family type III secretion system needle m